MQLAVKRVISEGLSIGFEKSGEPWGLRTFVIASRVLQHSWAALISHGRRPCDPVHSEACHQPSPTRAARAAASSKVRRRLLCRVRRALLSKRPADHRAGRTTPAASEKSLAWLACLLLAACQLPSPTAPSRTMASIFQSFPQLRTAAPRLTRHLFVCRPCPRAPPAGRVFSARAAASPRLPSLLKQQARWKSTQPLRSNVAAAEASIAEAAANTAAKSSSWPETSSKSVAYWLLGSAASVFGIVIFGGLTRLTESG